MARNVIYMLVFSCLYGFSLLKGHGIWALQGKRDVTCAHTSLPWTVGKVLEHDIFDGAYHLATTTDVFIYGHN